MKLLLALKTRSLRLLWGGQVFSAVGDELYGIALVWLAADLIGTRAGYLLAVQALAVLLTSLFGGIWADRWDHRRTLVGVDLFRGFAVLLLPAASCFGRLSIWLLVPVAIVVSGLKALFDPALRSCLPRLAEDEETLHATNA